MNVIELNERWGVRIVICTNAETLDINDEGSPLHAYEIASEAASAANDAVYEHLSALADVSSKFSDWNGGSYSGYVPVCWSYLERKVDLDEDSDEYYGEWQWGCNGRKPSKAIPMPLRSKVEAAIKAAIEAHAKVLVVRGNEASLALIEQAVEEIE